MPIVKPPSTLLVGPPGSGKTTSLATYIEAGLNLCVLITDPGGEESLIDAVYAKKLDASKLHYAYIPPMSLSWREMEDMATKVGMLSYKDLTSLKSAGKKQDTQFMRVLSTLSNFVDQHGEALGPVDDLDSSWALAVDSASGLNVMALDMMIGVKPIAHEGEYGVAMNSEEKLIQKLCSDLHCFFCLTAHVEKQLSDITGLHQINVGLLGKKLAPKIPRLFSDVVLSEKKGDMFSWSTTAMNVDLKNRALPLADNISPSFKQVVEKHWAREAAMDKVIEVPEAAANA